MAPAGGPAKHANHGQVVPEETCLAFNPTATFSTDANGWEQGIYCDDNDGAACNGRVNDCHSCPPCNAGLNCLTGNSDLIERVYVSCVQ